MIDETVALWRGLDRFEIALIKRMRLNKMKRDEIMSFFIRPGRVISSAAPAELAKKFPEIQPAPESDVRDFMNRRLAEAEGGPEFQGFSAASPIRALHILSLTRSDQAVLPGFESHIAELKREIPADRIGKAKVVKTMAAFANNVGGHIFFGVEDDGAIIGMPSEINTEGLFDDIGRCVREKLTPFFEWKAHVLDVNGFTIPYIYTFLASQKPIIADSDFTAEINSGDIFFRYGRITARIKPAELIQIIREGKAG